jgi:hypothetical protein
MQEIIHKDGTDLDYRKLWREVIMQAMRDACGVYVGSRKPTAKHVKNEAQRWLLSNSRDFRQVCEFAQISSEVVFSAAESLSKVGWAVPKKFFNLNFHVDAVDALARRVDKTTEI